MFAVDVRECDGPQSTKEKAKTGQIPDWAKNFMEKHGGEGAHTPPAAVAEEPDKAGEPTPVSGLANDAAADPTGPATVDAADEHTGGSEEQDPPSSESGGSVPDWAMKLMQQHNGAPAATASEEVAPTAPTDPTSTTMV